MPPSPPKLPLWQQLQAVAGVLQRVRDGGSGTAALEAVPQALRPGVQALSFLVLRQLGRAQALRQQLAPRTPPPAADALLCTALALLCVTEGAPYDAFTLVNQSVEAAKKQRSTQAQASFINACLRRFLRDRTALLADTDSNPVARWNHPAWWVQELQADWPAHWQQILTANAQHAPLVLRVNARRISVPAYLALLQAAGLAATPVGAHGLVLAQPQPVHKLPGFAEGLFSVQDSAAQLAAPLLLAPAPGYAPQRVLDACAAPGGKTAHLLELGVAQVTALDIDPQRCLRIHDSLQRLGLAAQVLTADAADVQAWWTGEPFDAVLLDAPCSGSGVVRRHPDIAWLRRATDIAQLAQVQHRLLRQLWPLLKPGGRLLYCTCSVFRAEGEGQINRFLADTPAASLLPSPGHVLPGASAGLIDPDGFYYGLLQKSA